MPSTISELFNHFMQLIGLKYYNKTESDNKYALKSEIPSSITIDNSLSNSSENPVQNKVIKNALEDKVDKVTGKGLSTEDYTSSEKTKLSSIEDGANKVTKTSELSNDSGYLTSHNPIDSNLDNSSSNAVENRVVKSALDGKSDNGHTHSQYLTSHQDITGKVNVSDIKDNLTSTDTDKPLSANQGKVLKGLVDGKASSSHTHNTGEVSDTSAYTNIGSSANATQKTINDKINTAIGNKANSSNVYSKSETYTQSEITTLISNAVSDLQLFEVVSTLPTSNIKTNRLYLIVNDETISNNSYDIYLRVNNNWEQLDGLEFDISNFYNKTEIDTLLNGKVDTSDSRLTNARTPTSHSHGDITNTGAIGTVANKPLITTTNGKITTSSFGTSANTFAEGNHYHNWDDIQYYDSYTGRTMLESDGDYMITAIGISYDTDNEELYFPCSTLYDADNVELAKVSDIPSTSNFIAKGSTTNLLLANGSNIAQSTFATSSHTHGNVTNDGKIGTASGKLITTGTGGALQASDSITKSMISDFPSSMTPTSHASTSTTYGAASTSNYGHAKLSTSTSSTSTTLAATPSAVKSAYDRASTALTTANGKLGTATYSNGTLTIS